MNKKRKAGLIIAISLIIAGCIIFVVSLAALDFDFTKFDTKKYETNTYEIDEYFNKLSLNATTAEIVFAASDDENCKVICYEPEKLKHSVTVKDETLIIKTVDTQKWYDYIGISFENPKIMIYLPENREYTSLLINTDTGNVEIPNNFTFENIEITGGTADVICQASASKLIEISTGTGDIEINSAASGEDIYMKTDTGKIRLTDADCRNLKAKSSTGSITIKNTMAMDAFSIKNITGDIIFENSDAAQIFVKTDTGNVMGSLVSEKVFITETKTGDVKVPKTTTGGKCEITTNTGNIAIDIQ